ncbi:hypothetical protein RCG24_07735 [Neobacillus sp. OS1-32]|nr:hypothetical protein [Neobacillus sp. OS1-32]WML31733.1 hypothetical protein RCG24_07735 [Neobacillus sp. OS1-32]
MKGIGIKMKKRLKTILLITFVLTLFGSSFSTIARAEEISRAEENQIQEMAEQLEFIFEDAAIKDSNGNLLTLDFKMIEDNFGSSPELEQLKQDMSLMQSRLIPTKGDKSIISPMDIKVDRCIEKKIKNGIGEILSVNAIASIVTYIVDGQYKLAAKKLIKLGVKGNAIAIGAQLSYYLIKCEYEVNGWWKN